MRGWVHDLAIGVRLAVGGGRTSVARFALSTVGIGIAVAVLLLASSVSSMIDTREARSLAVRPDTVSVPGVDPLRAAWSNTEFREHSITVAYLDPTGPASPLPPGLSRFPGRDEMVVSPAMAELLADPGSALLRERFPQTQVAVLGRDGVPDPGDLTVYTGADDLQLEDTPAGQEVYAFGAPAREVPLDPGLLLLLLVGTVALLVPVFIFVAASSRIAGAERDRRLSALRLVGSDGRQVRRIAAAEALVSSLAGLVLGAAVFLAGRQLAEGMRIGGVGVYPDDIAPSWWLTALIVLAVPGLAVLTAQFALRRTIIEPLGVVRYSKPVRRRVWWQLALIGLGVVLLLWHGGTDSNNQLWSYAIAAGASLLLIGVPVLLPWVVERSVARMSGGPSSWQLAVRRLQLDSGTSARVVGGVAVVLAGAIALQGVLLAQTTAFGEVPVSRERPYITNVQATSAVAEEAVAAVRDLPAVEQLVAFQTVGVVFADSPDRPSTSITVLDCSMITALYPGTGCADGDAFSVDPGPEADPFAPGRPLDLVQWDWRDGTETGIGSLTVPDEVAPLPARQGNPMVAGLLVTPSLVAGTRAAEGPVQITARLDPGVPDGIELYRNALAPLGYRVAQQYSYGGPEPTVQQQSLETIRRGLLIGSVFTLMLAGVSLLVLALEHIRERRRPLAILAASGVPTGALARSLLWQIAVPIVLGVLVALATGIGLTALVLRLTNDAMAVDWAGAAILAAAAAVLTLLVSAITLPFLRGATRLSSLRTE